MQVKVQVQNPDRYPDIQLRPEMNATVRFLANERRKMLRDRLAFSAVPPQFMIATERRLFSSPTTEKPSRERFTSLEPTERRGTGRRTGWRRKRHQRRANNIERWRQN